MSKRCSEHNCPNEADTILPVDLADRRELIHLCKEHYAEAVIQITKIQDSVVNMSKEDMIKRLKDICTPEQFNKLMEEIGREDRSYVN